MDASVGVGHDGSSWNKPFKRLQNALAAAKYGDEICVAQGVYKPDQGRGLTLGDRHATFELKAGVNQALSEKFNIFGTLAWVTGDLDLPSNSNLRNYVWSLGAAYSFGKRISINLKIVNGVNGVNGQDQVLRLGGRWTF